MAVARALCPVVVGRETQLGELEDALLEALRGEGGVMLVSGEAGMGKTRITNELAATARRLECAVLVGGCSEAELALPYLAFLEAIGNHLSRVDVAALRERLGSMAGELAHLFPQLGTPTATTGDAMQAKLRLFEAMLAVLRDAAQRGGLLLIVEDLHWADPATRELLDYMARRLRDERVLLVATFRSDELHRKHPLLPTLQGWRRAGLVREVELPSLDAPGVAGMVSAIFDQSEVSTEFRDFLLRRTEGNPFVLEEMLKASIDRGDIYRTETGWDRRAVAELLLPDTVRDTILLRFERLGDAEREVLSAAAAVGQTADVATLVAVTGLPEDEVLQALRACVLQQLLVEDGSAEGSYRFRHALTREAIYEDMLQPQRKRLHARVAEALRGRPGVRSVDLANHLLRAGLTAEGADLCVVAAREASAALAFSDAAELYQRAAEHAEGARRGELLNLCGIELWNNEDPDTARHRFEESVGLLEEAGATVPAAESRLMLGRCFWELQRSDLARQEYERARDVLEPLGPSPALATAYLRLASQNVFDNRPEAALADGTRAREIAGECGDALVEAWSWNFIGLGKLYMGRFREALEDLERSYRESQDAGFRFQAYNAIYNAAVTMSALGFGAEAARWIARPFRGSAIARCYLQSVDLVQRGDITQAIQQAREGRETALQSKFGKFDWRLSQTLAHALAEADRGEESARVLPPISAIVDAQDRLTDAEGRIRTAQALGELESAGRTAREIPPAACISGSPADLIAEVTFDDPAWLRPFLDACQMPGELASAPRWQAATAILALAEHRPEAAEVLAAAAQRLQDEGYRLPAWHLHPFLARALASRGETDRASDLLATTAQEAAEAGALLAARLARETAAELGFEPDAADHGPAAPDEVSTLGERLVTVLFVDVRGYTSLAARTAPADLAEKIGSLQRWAAQEVREHRGVVDKFAGDAVMATFNASGASIDHAEHALAAAIAIRDKAALLGLPVGAGIAVGPAVVGRLATSANISVLGDVTNLAARLQSSAGPGEIRLSEEAHRRVENRLAERGLSVQRLELELKGIDHPVVAYSVAAAPVEVA